MFQGLKFYSIIYHLPHEIKVTDFPTLALSPGLTFRSRSPTQEFNQYLLSFSRVLADTDLRGHSYVYAKKQVRTHLDQKYGKILSQF